MNNPDIISTLNKLIEVCKDGEASYKTRAESAEERNSHLQTAFASLQHRRTTAASELQGLVIKLGGIPRGASSTSDALHRSWVNLKIAISGKNDAVILIECERSEESAANQYKFALESDLPSEIRAVVERQSKGVLVNREQIKALWNQSGVVA